LAWTYLDESPVIRSETELVGAFDHLEYAVFRRFQQTLTRAERARLDNSISGALYKIERYLERNAAAPATSAAKKRFESLRDQLRDAREKVEQKRDMARRAELKLAQLGTLDPEGFEEFVAELLEALGFRVERTGGTGDDGVDLDAYRDELHVVVQCKYLGSGIIGAPELRRFLGTIHHTHAHRGIFVTTRGFTLSAERFAADHPIELIDGPKLVQLVESSLGGPRSNNATFW
jgi:restriction system protein